jgi:hypothetical protein
MMVNYVVANTNYKNNSYDTATTTTFELQTHLVYTGIVLLTCAAADAGSQMVPVTHRSHTIRDLNASPSIRFQFSVMQFYATTGCLFGFTRYSIHFVMVFIIQCNAFLMTLQRKNLASHVAMVTAYGTMLTIGFVVGAWEVHRVGAFWFLSTLSNTAALLRMGMRWNKYVLWICMSLLMYVTRSTMESSAWPFLYLASMVAMLNLAYTKIALEGRI